MRQIAARIHTGLAWLIFLGGFVALYLVGVSVFAGESAATHGAFGRILFLISLALLLFSLLCHSSRLNVGFSVLVPVMFFMQGMFVYIPAFSPAIRALHVLNGLAIMGICYSLANGRARAVIAEKQVAAGTVQAAD